MSSKNTPRNAAVRLYAERAVRLEIFSETCGAGHVASSDERGLVKASARETGGVRPEEEAGAREAVRHFSRDYGASPEAERRAIGRLLGDASVH